MLMLAATLAVLWTLKRPSQSEAANITEATVCFEAEREVTLTHPETGLDTEGVPDRRVNSSMSTGESNVCYPKVELRNCVFRPTSPVTSSRSFHKLHFV